MFAPSPSPWPWPSTSTSSPPSPSPRPRPPSSNSHRDQHHIQLLEVDSPWIYARYPRESEVGRREDGLVAAEEQTVFSPTSDDPASIVTETQRSLSEVITIYYWREDGGNIITTAGLEKMRQVEKFVQFPKNASLGRLQFLPQELVTR